MNIGLIGLGKMGHAIAQRLINAHHSVIGFDYDQHAQDAFKKIGGILANSPEELCRRVSIIWLMIPTSAIDTTLDTIIASALPETIIIDGGNSYYQDSINRANRCKQHGFSFLDCGTSGGLQGKQYGFCLMVGGDIYAYDIVAPVLHTIAAPEGVSYLGKSGIGHYVKMIHNGIEYGILQAYAEGFHLLKDGTFKNQHLDLANIAHLWNTSSVIRSWILQLSEEVLANDPQFTSIEGSIEELGTGKWALQEAKQKDIPTPVLQESLNVREWSRQTGGNYATKIIALLRNKFGGHPVKQRES